MASGELILEFQKPIGQDNSAEINRCNKTGGDFKGGGAM